jgi:hypothetical protein
MKHVAGEHKVRPYKAKICVNNASFSVGANLVFARLACQSRNQRIFARASIVNY